jgi:Protein of unknown function (DUF3027)
VTETEREQQARDALADFASPGTFGDLISETREDDGVYTLLFAATMGGYPGWHWTVSLAEVPGAEPTVLETELMPGEGALLAPDWVPWSERLEEYRAAQAAAGQPDESVLLDAEDDDAEDDDDVDLDDDHGDDPDDGIDFEGLAADEAAGGSDLLAVGEDEEDEPEPEPDDAGPEPPAAPALKNRRQKKQ